MHKQTGIVQFAPDSRDPHAQGTYGWGFDLNGFRVVMYAPQEFDTPVVQELNRRLGMKKPAERTTGEDDEHHDERFEHHKLAKKNRHKEAKKALPRSSADKISRGQEHGPAHLHVIDKESGRESKFELIEHFEPDRHFARLIEKHRDEVRPLTAAQQEAVLPILTAHAEEFIQLWREFYQDYKLSNYVTRISEKFPHCEETIYFDKGRDREGKHDTKMIHLKDMRNGHETVMTFDDYVSYFKGDDNPKPRLHR